MSDDLTARRTARTMHGVVCALTKGPLKQDDLDEIERFKAYLQAIAHLPPGARCSLEQRAEKQRIYHEHYPKEEQL